MSIKPGFYTPEQLSYSKYQEVDAIDHEGLELIDRSPSHFKAPKDESKPRNFIGSAMYAAVLNPERFKKEFVIASADEFADRRAKGFKAWKEEQDDLGLKILMEKEAVAAMAMKEQLFSHSIASGLLEDAQYEYSIISEDPETGELCKCRPNVISANGWFVEIFPCSDARLEWVKKTISDNDHHLRSEWFRNVATWQSAEVDSAPQGVAFIFIEKEPPYALKVYQIDDVAQERGRDECRRLLDIYHDCKASGKWPGYEEQAEWVSLQDWKL